MKRAALVLCLLASGVQAQTLPTPHYGGVTLEGSSSGSSTFAAPASGSTITITLPGTAGTSGQVLTHGAGDALAWTSAASVANGIQLETAGTSQKISVMSALAVPPGAMGTMVPVVVPGDATNYRSPLATLLTGAAGTALLQGESFTITTGDDGPTGAQGAGGLNLRTGADVSGGGGGTLTIITGDDVAGGGPGGISVALGTSATTGVQGGSLSLATGIAAAGDADGGDISFSLGAGSGTGRQGLFRITPLPANDPSVPDAFWSDRGVLQLSGSTPALAHTDVAQSFTKAQRGAPVTLSLSGATATPNYDNGQNFALTLVHASCPCTLANPSTTPVAGQAGQIVVTQSATGSDTLAFGNEFKFAGGVAPTLSTGANAVDILSYYVVSPTVIAVTALLDFQ